MTLMERRRALMTAQEGDTMQFQKLTEVTIEADSTIVKIPFTPKMQNCDILWILPKFTLTASDYLYYDKNDNRATNTAVFGYCNATTDPGIVAVANTREVVVDGTSIGNKMSAVYGFANVGHYNRDGLGENTYIGITPYTNTTKFNAGTVEVWGWA